jgi:hypothetical protein
MTPPSRDKRKTFTLLVEAPNGVTDYFVGLMKVDETPVITHIAARVLSGEGTSLSWDSFQEALELQQWALKNADVFKEGRVAYDS